MSSFVHGVVTREMKAAPEVAQDVVALLDNYIAFVRGEVVDFDHDLVEKVMRICDNTWNNESMSAAAIEKSRRLLQLEVDSALNLAKEAYVRCLENLQGLQVSTERISEQDRALRCTLSWIATPPEGRHIRYASPRDTKPAGLAHFLRTAIESAAIAY